MILQGWDEGLTFVIALITSSGRRKQNASFYKRTKNYGIRSRYELLLFHFAFPCPYSC